MYWNIPPWFLKLPTSPAEYLPTLPTDPETPAWGLQHHWEVCVELGGLCRPLEERKPNCTFKNSSNSKFHLLPKIIDLWDQKVWKVMFSRINISNSWGGAVFVNQDGVCACWVCLGDKQHLFCEGQDYLRNFSIGKRETVSRNISCKAVWISRDFLSFLSLKCEALGVFICSARAKNVLSVRSCLKLPTISVSRGVFYCPLCTAKTPWEVCSHRSQWESCLGHNVPLGTAGDILVNAWLSSKR